MSYRSILFPDPSEQIKPEMNFFPRKISYDYEDYQNQQEQEYIFKKVAIYNPVQVKSFEECIKSKCYTNYFMYPTDYYEMYGGVMPNNRSRKLSSNSSDSSSVVDTLF